MYHKQHHGHYCFTHASILFVYWHTQALYQSWVLAPQRHILAVLEDICSLRPPVDHLCELLPRLQARYYSIASSAKVRPAHQCKKKKYFHVITTIIISNTTFTPSQAATTFLCSSMREQGESRVCVNRKTKTKQLTEDRLVQCCSQWLHCHLHCQGVGVKLRKRKWVVILLIKQNSKSCSIWRFTTSPSFTYPSLLLTQLCHFAIYLTYAPEEQGVHKHRFLVQNGCDAMDGC